MEHMKEITDRLTAIGTLISEEDQIVTLLGSLPASYSALVTTLESRIDDVKLSFVQQALLHEERKQQESSSGPVPSNQSDSALLGAQDRPRRMVRCFVNWGVFAVNKGILRTSDQLTKPR